MSSQSTGGSSAAAHDATVRTTPTPTSKPTPAVPDTKKEDD